MVFFWYLVAFRIEEFLSKPEEKKHASQVFFKLQKPDDVYTCMIAFDEGQSWMPNHLDYRMASLSQLRNSLTTDGSWFGLGVIGPKNPWTDNGWPRYAHKPKAIVVKLLRGFRSWALQ